MTSEQQRLTRARSLLFVPGSRPERFEKAAAAGADLVVLDLEDAVPPDQKDAALQHVTQWLRGGQWAVVRINGAGTPWHEAEVSAMAGLFCAVVVPKAEDGAGLTALGQRLGRRLIALVETARGVRDLDAVAAAHGVERLALGTIDLAAELQVDPTSGPALAYSRGRMVVASAAAGLAAPIDGVTTALDDEELLRSDTRAARALGFGGKLCIHPRQVRVVLEALRPPQAEVRWAERVVQASAGGGVAVVDGAMVDPPVLARARAVLSREGRA